MTDWNTPDAPAPAWSVPDKPLTALVDSYAEDRADVPRNHHNQYLIPSADGRQPANSKGRPRVSTLAKIGTDTSLLEKRAVRLVAAGIAKDPSINAEAMKAEALQDDTKEKKEALQKVAARAFAAAGGHDRANRGVRIHQLVEDIKRGKDVAVPDELKADVDAYFAVLQKNGLEFCPEFMERVVLCPYDFGGAVDDIMRRWNPDTEMYEYVVVDTKTGASLDFSKLPIKTQLWMYANAICFFVTTYIGRDKDGKINEVRGYQEDMPLELRRDKAVIIHLDGLGAAYYYEVNIGGHGRVVAAQVELKRADTEAKHDFRLVDTVRSAAFVQPVTNIPPGPVYNESFPVMSGPATSSVVSGTGYTDMIDRTFGDRATDTMRAQAAAADAAPITVTGVSGTTVATDALIENSAVLDGEGKPLGPLADKSKKERGCSVCGRKGHKSTSPRCLKDRDPAKLADRAARDQHAAVAPVLNGDVPDDGPSPSDMVARIDAAAAPGRNDDPDDGVPIPAGPPAPENNCDHLGDGDWHPFVPGQCDIRTVETVPLPENTEYPVGSAQTEPASPAWPAAVLQPYCTPADHAGPCAWTPRPEGRWVCGQSGKPSKLVWEQRQAGIMAEITATTTPQELVMLKQRQESQGQWSPEHDAEAFAKYQALTRAPRPN